MKEWDKLLSYLIILIGLGINLFNVANDPAITSKNFSYFIGASLSSVLISLFILSLYYIGAKIFKMKYSYLRIFAWILLVIALLGLPMTYINIHK